MVVNSIFYFPKEDAEASRELSFPVHMYPVFKWFLVNQIPEFTDSFPTSPPIYLSSSVPATVGVIWRIPNKQYAVRSAEINVAAFYQRSCK